MGKDTSPGRREGRNARWAALPGPHGPGARAEPVRFGDRPDRPSGRRAVDRQSPEGKTGIFLQQLPPQRLRPLQRSGLLRLERRGTGGMCPPL